MTSPTDAALIVGATLRLTRLVVDDDLGEWCIKTPAHNTISSHYRKRGEDTPQWAHDALSGLDCGWCIGFWVGAGVYTTTTLTTPTSRTGLLWRHIMGALALNYATATFEAKYGATPADDE